MTSSGICEKNSIDVDIFNSRRKTFKGERGLITGQNGITYLLHRIRKDRIINLQGVKLSFFSDSHLGPKFFKVVASSKKVGRHFQIQTKSFFTLSSF